MGLVKSLLGSGLPCRRLCRQRGAGAALWGAEVGRMPPATSLLVARGPSRVAVGKRRDEALLLVEQPVSSLLLPILRVCCSPPYLTWHGAQP